MRDRAQTLVKEDQFRRAWLPSRDALHFEAMAGDSKIEAGLALSHSLAISRLFRTAVGQ